MAGAFACRDAGVFPDQKQRSAIAHLKAALAYYRRLGVTVKRVMTDNGPCYTSHAFAATCIQFGLKHIRTQPYTPRTHGKAERFIQTALREWAYLPAAGRRQSLSHLNTTRPGPAIMDSQV